MYPSPNNGDFSLKIENENIKRIRIVNTRGQIVYMKNYGSINNHVNVKTNLRNGEYIVFIEGLQNKYMKKIVIY